LNVLENYTDIYSRELLFIEARNNHVKDGLQAAYSSQAPGNRLDVFCVSNKMYEKYSRKGNSQFVEASGIPDLRKFCFQITADAQLREAKHFLQSSVFNLLTSFEVCLSSLASSSNDSVALVKSKKLADDAMSATVLACSNPSLTLAFAANSIYRRGFQALQSRISKQILWPVSMIR
jgi:hypothetical protein